MEAYVSLFLISSVVFFCFAIFEGVSLLLQRNRTEVAIGTIEDIVMSTAKTMKVYNSKWARLSYLVKGKRIISTNFIQIPTSCKLGEKIPIKYDTYNPERLVTRSTRRLIIYTACFLLLLVIAIFFV